MFYKVRRIGQFWYIWLINEDNEPIRPIDGNPPYKHRQSAYKRCKKLNDLLKRTDEEIARTGAIIV